MNIPDDVMGAAHAVYAQLPEMDFDISGMGATTLIARALLSERESAVKAERERCKGPWRNFGLGDLVTKTKGSSWTGHVVGFYATELTSIGYAVESVNEPGSVQIYPESALAAAIRKGGG